MRGDAPPLPWRRALVIGLGCSGRESTALLRHLGLEVRAYDRNQAATASEGITLFLGEPAPPAEAFSGIDLLVLSPGVPPDEVRALARIHAPEATIHGEMSLALDLLGRRWPGLPTVLITGTNGKSTVTALTGEVLDAGGLDPFTGGNLGVPLSAAVLALLRGERRPPGSLVLECSSYQLETMNGALLHPTDVAMVLNVTPDHLERYADIHDYAATKARIFAGLKEHSLALLDAGDPFTPSLREQVRGDLALIDGPGPDDPTILGAGAGKHLRLQGDELLPRKALALAGRHNSKNALFALAAARHLGVSLAACRAGLRSFAGLPHRMILIREVDGVRYYDDSKATNIASVIANIDGFDRPYVLIAGGRRKDDDLTLLRPHLAKGARALVAIGESTDAFGEIAEGIVPWAKASNMDEAVAKASHYARSGDAVLLSPACSSFDWFRNYAERGDVFIRAVQGLPDSSSSS